MPAAFLALLLAPSAQVPVARWTPELAFSVKRVGSVAVSPDGRWAAVEVSEPLMEADPSEWRTSVDVYVVGGTGPGAARRVETPASAPAWSPDGRWLAFASSRSGKRDVWRVARDGSGGGVAAHGCERGAGRVSLVAGRPPDGVRAHGPDAAGA